MLDLLMVMMTICFGKDFSRNIECSVQFLRYCSHEVRWEPTASLNPSSSHWHHDAGAKVYVTLDQRSVCDLETWDHIGKQYPLICSMRQPHETRTTQGKVSTMILHGKSHPSWWRRSGIAATSWRSRKNRREVSSTIIEKEGSIIWSTGVWRVGVRTRPVEDFRTNQIHNVPELKALETRRSI